VSQAVICAESLGEHGEESKGMQDVRCYMNDKKVIIEVGAREKS